MAAIPTPRVTAPGTQVPPSPRRRSSASTPFNPHRRRTSSHSIYARNVLMSKLTLPGPHAQNSYLSNTEPPRPASAQPALPIPAPPKSVQQIKDSAAHHGDLKPLPLNAAHHHGHAIGKDGVGIALSDTPLPSHPGSPREYVTAPPSE